MVVTRSASSSEAAAASGAPSSDTPPSDNQLQGGVTAQPEVQVIDSQTDGIDSEVGQQQQKGESLNLLFGMSLKGWK